MLRTLLCVMIISSCLSTAHAALDWDKLQLITTEYEDATLDEVLNMTLEVLDCFISSLENIKTKTNHTIHLLQDSQHNLTSHLIDLNTLTNPTDEPYDETRTAIRAVSNALAGYTDSLNGTLLSAVSDILNDVQCFNESLPLIIRLCFLIQQKIINEGGPTNLHIPVISVQYTIYREFESYKTKRIRAMLAAIELRVFRNHPHINFNMNVTVPEDPVADRTLNYLVGELTGFITALDDIRNWTDKAILYLDEYSTSELTQSLYAVRALTNQTTLPYSETVAAILDERSVLANYLETGHDFEIIHLLDIIDWFTGSLPMLRQTAFLSRASLHLDGDTPAEFLVPILDVYLMTYDESESFAIKKNKAMAALSTLEALLQDHNPVL